MVALSVCPSFSVGAALDLESLGTGLTSSQSLASSTVPLALASPPGENFLGPERYEASLLVLSCLTMSRIGWRTAPERHTLWLGPTCRAAAQGQFPDSVPL